MMQLIYETEEDINVTYRMSTLEEVVDKKPAVNGILDELVNDVNIGNKENINKPINITNKESEKHIVKNNMKCTENQLLADADTSSSIVKKENEDSDVQVTVNKDTEDKLEMPNNEPITKNVEVSQNQPDDNKEMCVAKVESCKDNVEEDVVKKCVKHQELVINRQEIREIATEEISLPIKLETDNIPEICSSTNLEIDSDKDSKIYSAVVQKETNTENNIKYPSNVISINLPVDAKLNDNVYTEIKTQPDHENTISSQNEVLEKNPLNKNSNIENKEINEDLHANNVTDDHEYQEKDTTGVETSGTKNNINNEGNKKIGSESLNVKTFQDKVNVDSNNADVDLKLSESDNLDVLKNVGSSNSSNIAMDCDDVDEVNDKETKKDNDTCCPQEEIMLIDEEEDGSIVSTNIDNTIHCVEDSNDKETKQNTSATDPKNEVMVIDEEKHEDFTTSHSLNNHVDCDDLKKVISNEIKQNSDLPEPKDEIMVIDEEKDEGSTTLFTPEIDPIDKVVKEPEISSASKASIISRLSNTLDILSDDDDEPTVTKASEENPIDNAKETVKTSKVIKQAINIEDDDDIVLIDEEVSNKTKNNTEENCNEIENNTDKNDVENIEIEGKKSDFMESIELSSVNNLKESTSHECEGLIEAGDSNKVIVDTSEITEPEKPLLVEGFTSTSKKMLADMTREELEEFCVMKIVESIVDRSNLSEIKLKLKTMSQKFEEYNKATKVLTKQNKDLQYILKSIQEQQKKSSEIVIPLKITRSVGMQVLMIENQRKKGTAVPSSSVNSTKTRNQSPRSQRQSNCNIPVPRLVPASNNSSGKNSPTVNSPSNTVKLTTPIVNGTKVNTIPQKPEKRPLNKSQSDCVDLTDDEPPSKMITRNQPTPPVRVVPTQNLLTQQRPQVVQSVMGPRKVYIPISSPQNQSIRPGQTFMVKAAGPRPRQPQPNLARMPQNRFRFRRIAPNFEGRHPAPLPECQKQFRHPSWKELPPAPELKLSKVENGIVISWKIEGYLQDSYEEIASYQLYAYQETAAPPSTSLWKKIGDVKALPLPMACTLTQFIAGFKYFFAVRAVDVRSRVGPFSAPGSILLFNKM